jgi:hypothetical protein
VIGCAQVEQRKPRFTRHVTERVACVAGFWLSVNLTV